MKKGKGKKLAAFAAIFFLIWISAGQDVRTASTPIGTAVRRNLSGMFADALYSMFLPGMARRQDGGGERIAVRQAEGILPLYGMARREMAGAGDREDGGDRTGDRTGIGAGDRTGDRAEGRAGAGEGDSAGDRTGDSAGAGADGMEFSGEEDGHSVFLEYDALMKNDIGQREEFPGEGGTEREKDLYELVREENEAAAAVAEDPVSPEAAADDFVPHEKRMQVDLEELRDYDTLVRTFYTIDASTFAGSDQLNAESLLARDMTIRKNGDEPQILIYHTHSQEAYADSAPGDPAATVMGVGEHLADILRTVYGYNVLHHTGQYDTQTRDDAYGRTLPVLEQILAENPSIEVVIDLHRDQMPEGTRMVTDLDGRPTARFMFFNGLSRTKKTGDITYLKNENLAANLAFSFQMQLKGEEYYPGLTRKIYLKGYRYNLHLRPRSVLVELGAQNNTVEEAMNACDPLAHLLDLVLSGEEL